MNKVVLIGRLTRDPELRYTGNNTPVCSFTLAIDRVPSSQNQDNNNNTQTADFINVVVWNRAAENCKNYLTKGSQCAVDGRIQTRSYDDQNGQRRYVTEVVASRVEFLGSRNSSNNSNTSSATGNNAGPTPYDFADNNSSNSNTSKSSKGTDVDSNPFADFGSNIEISDDELPF